eukprot:765070-Hanusia_phi.AAC.2
MPVRTSIFPMWNAELEDLGFPRWQDGEEVDFEEMKRVNEAGYPFRHWLAKLLNSGDEDSKLMVSGLPSLPKGLQLVALTNCVQSNFMAPYDFIIADRKVIRQKYAVKERPFPVKENCWVFQIQGEGEPRIVNVRLGHEDSIISQQEPMDLFHLDDFEAPSNRSVDVACGVSGLPLLLNGQRVSMYIQWKSNLRPMRPNEVTWNPETTKAAFSAICTRGTHVCLATVFKELSVHEFAACLQDFGMQDALLLGGSADVCSWVRQDAILVLIDAAQEAHDRLFGEGFHCCLPIGMLCTRAASKLLVFLTEQEKLCCTGWLAVPSSKLQALKVSACFSHGMCWQARAGHLLTQQRLHELPDEDSPRRTYTAYWKSVWPPGQRVQQRRTEETFPILTHSDTSKLGSHPSAAGTGNRRGLQEREAAPPVLGGSKRGRRHVGLNLQVNTQASWHLSDTLPPVIGGQSGGRRMRTILPQKTRCM